MNTQSDNIGDLAAALAKAQAEVGTDNPFFQLTMIGRMDSISVWRKSITSTITSLKRLARFTMSEKGLGKDTLFSSGVVNYGMRSIESMVVML
jgi:hypothetical protein